MGCSVGQFRRAQRPRGGRQDAGTGYAAPADLDYAAPAQPAYGDDQDVYQVSTGTLALSLVHILEIVRSYWLNLICDLRSEDSGFSY